MKRRTTLSLLAAGLTIGTLPASAASFAVERSSPYVLFMFAPDTANGPAVAQYEMLQKDGQAIQNANMVQIYVIGNTPVKMPPDGHTEEAANLRKRYHVDATAFRVVLLGENGAEKTRWSEPVQPQEIILHTNELPKPKELPR